MAQKQRERLAEIVSLSTRLSCADNAKATQIIRRIDTLVEEAAAVESVNGPEQAAASLEIALAAMGADCKHPRPEERLIHLASCFLKSLVCLTVAGEVMLAPSMHGFTDILCRMTGLT